MSGRGAWGAAAGWSRGARGAGLLVAWVVLLWAMPARAVDCLGAAGDARRAGDVGRALTLVDEALGEAECQRVRVHLEMLRALTLHDIAELRDEPAIWCAARDAFEGVQRSEDAEYREVAGRKIKVAERGCRDDEPQVVCPACEVCPACPVVEAGSGWSHWWLTGPGLGLVVAGGVLVGLGVEQHGVAEDLAARADAAERDGSALTLGEYRRLDGAENNAHLFAGVGGALAGVGLVACIAGLAVGVGEGEGEAPVSFGVAPGGVSVRWQFK